MVGQQDHEQEGSGLGRTPPATSGRSTPLQEGKQGIFSFSLSPEFFERHHEAFVLSCGVGERLPDASLRVGGELREDRAVGPLWAEGKGDLGNRLGNRSCPWLGEDDQPAIVAHRLPAGKHIAERLPQERGYCPTGDERADLQRQPPSACRNRRV